MRFRVADLLVAAALAGIVTGCASMPRPKPPDVALDEALKRLPIRPPTTLSARGRLGVRAPDGDSNLAFRLAYDARMGMRLDLTWKGLVGLVRRDGSLLVRGDSAWAWATSGDSVRSDEQMDLFEGPFAGDFLPGDFVELVVGGLHDLAEKRAEVASYERVDPRGTYRIALRGASRVTSVVFDATNGHLLERTLTDRQSGRRLHASYGRYGSAASGERPGAVDVTDSSGPVRFRFVISDQDTTLRSDPRIFRAPAGARLLQLSPGGRERSAVLGELPRS